MLTVFRIELARGILDLLPDADVILHYSTGRAWPFVPVRTTACLTADFVHRLFNKP